MTDGGARWPGKTGGERLRAAVTHSVLEGGKADIRRRLKALVTRGGMVRARQGTGTPQHLWASSQGLPTPLWTKFFLLFFSHRTRTGCSL